MEIRANLDFLVNPVRCSWCCGQTSLFGETGCAHCKRQIEASFKSGTSIIKIKKRQCKCSVDISSVEDSSFCSAHHIRVFGLPVNKTLPAVYRVITRTDYSGTYRMACICLPWEDDQDSTCVRLRNFVIVCLWLAVVEVDLTADTHGIMAIDTDIFAYEHDGSRAKLHRYRLSKLAPCSFNSICSPFEFSIIFQEPTHFQFWSTPFWQNELGSESPEHNLSQNWFGKSLISVPRAWNADLKCHVGVSSWKFLAELDVPLPLDMEAHGTCAGSGIVYVNGNMTGSAEFRWDLYNEIHDDHTYVAPAAELWADVAADPGSPVGQIYGIRQVIVQLSSQQQTNIGNDIIFTFEALL